MKMRYLALTLSAALMATLAACAATDSVAPSGAVLTSVAPQGGFTRIEPTGPVTLSFSVPLQRGAEAYVALHAGDAAGSRVEGSWSASLDGRTLSFTAAAPLASRSRYTIHVGGGMADSAGQAVDLRAGKRMGGHWVTGDMAVRARSRAANPDMLETEWQGRNGYYGMMFTFMTK